MINDTLFGFLLGVACTLGGIVVLGWLCSSIFDDESEGS